MNLKTFVKIFNRPYIGRKEREKKEEGKRKKKKRSKRGKKKRVLVLIPRPRYAIFLLLIRVVTGADAENRVCRV